MYKQVEYLSFGLLFLGFLSANFLWNFGKRDTFLEKEANRCLNNFCKVEDSWDSEGKVFTNGVIFTKNKETGQVEIIKQAKLCDVGLLKQFMAENLDLW